MLTQWEEKLLLLMGWRRTCRTDQRFDTFSPRNLRPTKENAHGTNDNLFLQTKSDLSHFVWKTSNETQRTRVACIDGPV